MGDKTRGLLATARKPWSHRLPRRPVTTPKPSTALLFIVASLSSNTLYARDLDLTSTLLRDASGRSVKEVAGFRLISATQDDAIHFIFTLDPENPRGENLIEFTLIRRDDSKPALARSASFNIEYRGPTTGGRPAPAVSKLAEEVVALVISNDPGGLIIAPPKPKALGEGGEVPAHVFLIDRLSAYAGIFLVLLFLLTLPLSLQTLFRTLKTAFWPNVTHRFTLTLLVTLSFATGLILRLFLPHFPVMYYMGYHLAATASTLEGIPKYGPGALALYHLVFQVAGTDHIAMMYTNSILGSLTPLAGAALLLRLGFPATSATWAIAFLSLTPLFIKDATTESILVPTTLWTLMGLVMLLHYRNERRYLSLLLAFLHLTLAVFSRPEAVLLVPLTSLVFFLVVPQPKSEPRKMQRKILRYTPWVLVAALFLLRLAQLTIALEIEFARGNNPILKDPAALVALLPDLWRRNILFMQRFFPVIFTALAALSVLFPQRRLAAAAILLSSCLWLAASLVDLPYVSIPRVQVPAAVFCTLGAAVGLAKLFYRFSQSRAFLVSSSIVTMTVIPFSMLFTIPALWTPTNSDSEEELLRQARQFVPRDNPFILVRRGYDDAPRERLHLHYPDYWFEPPSRPGLVVGPDWFERTDVKDREAFFLLGTRCYMRQCGAQGLHPSCERILNTYMVEPIYERVVPVHRLPVDRATSLDQDLDFPWCLAATKEMRIGLYRILGKKPEQSDQPRE